MSQFFRMAVIAVAAFAGSWFLTVGYIRAAGRFFHSSAGRIPSGAGFVFGVCSLAAAAVFRPGGGSVFLLPAAFMLLSGILDDIFEFSAPVKMLFQITAVALLAHNGLSLGILSAAADAVLTVIWVLGITNAFNYLDIVDGLAASLGIVSSFSFFILFAACGDSARSAVFFFLCLSLSGFFLSNYPPAKVYMGNTGSHFIGFMLALAPLTSVYAPVCAGTNILPSAVLISGMPVFDTAFVTLLRFYRRQPLFKKSGDHLALRLIGQGVPLNGILKQMTAASAFFCASGLLFYYPPLRLLSAAAVLPALFICFRLARVAVRGGR